MRVRQSTLLCSDISREPSPTALKSPNLTEDYPLDNPTCALQSRVRAYRFLDASMVFNIRLVLRAVNAPNIKKYRFLERKLFVTVSNAETTAKTTDVRVEKHMAKWNQSLDPL
jgi:hypothetical protein